MLRSVFQTSLSGISAASLGIRVSANNLANLQTEGFKASRPVFAERPSQTDQPELGGGRTNPLMIGPLMIGSGVQVTAIDADPSPGSLWIDSDDAIHEHSNTDIGRELVNLSRYSTTFRANLAVLETGHSLLDELFQLRRF